MHFINIVWRKLEKLTVVNAAHLFGVSDAETVHTQASFALTVITERIHTAALHCCYFATLVCTNHTVAFRASFPITNFGTMYVQLFYHRCLKRAYQISQLLWAYP